MKHSILLSVLLLSLSLNINGQVIWTSVNQTLLPERGGTLDLPDQYHVFRYNSTSLSQLLEQAPQRFSAEAKTKTVILSLPMPDGSFRDYKITHADILHPALASLYPEIRSYAGQGILNPAEYLRLSFTTKGLHAMVLGHAEGTLIIDPYIPGNQEYVLAYLKKDFNPGDRALFECGTIDEDLFFKNDDQHIGDEKAGDCQLRTFRLALACTGEYATYHGGTEMDVLAAMAVTMTRVNGIFERDVTLTMEVIPNTNELFFYDPDTDPYTNNSVGVMLGENQYVIDSIIGDANYDIGHVFGTAGGGVVGGNACNSGGKARGVTGLSNPVGDIFDVDYVSHEMGHQYRAGHTQGNTCNRSMPSAMEPGSASTIMGYAGICAPNVQGNSDDYFHAISIQQMAVYTNSGNGSLCPIATVTGNNPPQIIEGNDFVLPISTPFVLAAEGSDPDGDMITYCWEQMDNELADMPPVSTSTGGPAFRTFLPTTDSFRYFPRLSDLTTNTDYDWEELPSVSRTMNFRCTVRDNFMGAGCTSEDDRVLTFSETAGPFLVTYPNGFESWAIGDFETITWDVAGTNLAPVSCDSVTIVLSTDGGLTYDIVLANPVLNNGSYTIEVPDFPGTTNRIQVRCSESIFFDISDDDFEIAEQTFPSFAMGAIPPTGEVCGQDGPITFQVALNPLGGFFAEVNLVAQNLPPGATVTFFPSFSVYPPAVVNVTVQNYPLQAGPLAITIGANSDGLQNDVTYIADITPDVPMAPMLGTPLDLSNNLDPTTTLTWSGFPISESFDLEIATNPSFGANVVESTNTLENTYTPANLDHLTVYYWRVRANNLCGPGSWSTVYSFQTSPYECEVFSSKNVPVDITGADTVTVWSDLPVFSDFEIVDLQVSMEANHTWVGDLSATLYAPNDSVLTLFDRPGQPASFYGCDRDNLLLEFDDEAGMTAEDLETLCIVDAPYALEGIFQGIDTLSKLNGSSVNGDWRLVMFDAWAADGGELFSWSIEACYIPLIPENLTLAQEVLEVEEGFSEQITSTFLNAQSTESPAEAVVYTLTSLPSHGELLLNGAPLEIGDTFTQQDIDNGFLVYSHNGLSLDPDQFTFDLLDGSNSWFPGNIFSINILMLPTSVGEIFDQKTVELFPNPASDAVTLRVYSQNPETAKMQLIDALGRVVMTDVFEIVEGVTLNSIALKGLVDGVYHIRLEIGKELVVKKMAVVRP
ncbi:MAG: reprolysin-like metallopeptidase [Bacteroidota bacterium]